MKNVTVKYFVFCYFLLEMNKIENKEKQISLAEPSYSSFLEVLSPIRTDQSYAEDFVFSECSKYIFISIFVVSCKLTRVTSCKYFDVFIDHNLNWDVRKGHL